MLVKDIIKQLQNEKWYKPTDNLMIGWCDSEAVNGDGRMTPELWEEACALADNSEYLFDRQVAADLVKEAENKLNYIASPSWSKRSDNHTGAGDYAVFNARGQFLEEVLDCDNATAAVSWYNCNIHRGPDTTFQAEYALCNCEYEEGEEQ